MTNLKANPASAIQPRGLSVITAARYMGVSPGTFRKRSDSASPRRL